MLPSFAVLLNLTGGNTDEKKKSPQLRKQNTLLDSSHKNTVSSACGVPANLSASYDLYRHVCLSSLYEGHQQ